MKIAYFDYWTKGIHHFKPIDVELKKLGHETVLLHIGSFRAPCGKEEVIEGIRCRDVRYYGTDLIFKMLEIEKPDAVITLNNQFLVDRTVVLSCRKLNIKTAFMNHGIINVGSSMKEVIELSERSFGTFRVRAGRALKNIRRVIPNYLYALARYDAKLLLNMKFIKVILSYLISPGRSIYYPKHPEELVHDKTLIYCNNDIAYYKDAGCGGDSIVVVGNPKHTGLLENIRGNKFTVEMLPPEVRELVLKGRRYALMLEGSYPELQNYGGITNQYRNEYIHSIAQRLEKENITLVVKLHPGTIRENVDVNHPNAVICGKNLDELINFSYFCISHLSTAVNSCVLLDKPVLHPYWGKFKGIETYFVDLGIANPWRDINDELNIGMNKDARKKYIDEYITVTQPVAVQNIVREVLALSAK